MTESQFPDNLGLIGVGDGKVVLPGPAVDEGWNLLIRDYEDRDFRFSLVAGLEPIPDSLGYQFVEADTYRLEVTPDVGLRDVGEMFVPYDHATQTGNGRLRIFRDLRLGTDLTVQDDTTVIFQVPLEDMRRVLAPGYDRYLWRVVAVSPAGHEGHPSLVQSFRGRVVVPSVDWTVEKPSGPLQGLTARLHGTRAGSVSSIEVNDTDTWSTYPGPGSWEAEIPLSGGRNVFYVRAFDAQGNGSEYRQVEIEVENNDLTQGSYFNTFDEFGYLMGLARLPGERNASYRTRIEDVLVHRAGPRYGQLMNGFGRELDLAYYDRALRILVKNDPDNGLQFHNVIAWLTSSYLYVSDPRMYARQEYAEIEGHTWRVTAAEDHPLSGFIIEQPIGHTIPATEYNVEDGYIQFKSPAYLHAPIYLSYRYAKAFKSYDRTIDDLVAEMNAFTIFGKMLLEVTRDTTMTGTERASGLQLFPLTDLSNSRHTSLDGVVSDALPIRWMEVELYSFMDQDFIDRFWNENNSLFGTRYSGWAMRIKNQLHTTWGFLVADKNVWTHDKLRTSGIGTLPTNWDSFQGGWMATSGGPVYSTRQAWPRGFKSQSDFSKLQAHGVPRIMMYSGIGDSWDLTFAIDGVAPVTLTGTSFGSYFVRETSTSSDLGLGTSGVDTSSEVS